MGIGPVEIVFLVGGLAVMGGLLAALIIRTRSRVFVDRWAEDHGIALTDQTRAIVGRYLSRGVRARSAGAVIGAVLPLGTDVPGLEMVLGYLVAAILVEMRARPIVEAETRTAELTPRDVVDYVPATPLRQFRIACAAALVVCASVAVIPMRVSMDEFVAAPIVVAIGVVVLSVTVEWALRMIARRPQPAGTVELVAADDALRSASMHAVLGAGIGVAFLLFGSVTFGVSLVTDVQVLRWVGPWLGLVSLALGIVSWLRLGHDTPWVVRRSNLAQVRT